MSSNPNTPPPSPQISPEQQAAQDKVNVTAAAVTEAGKAPLTVANLVKMHEVNEAYAEAVLALNEIVYQASKQNLADVRGAKILLIRLRDQGLELFSPAQAAQAAAANVPPGKEVLQG